MSLKIDLSYLRDLVGDELYIRELAKTFYEDAPRDYEKLSSALAASKHADARVLAHKLKSSLAIFKVEPLRSSFEKMEKMCIEGGDIHEIRYLNNTLASQLDEVMGSIERYLGA